MLLYSYVEKNFLELLRGQVNGLCFRNNFNYKRLLNRQVQCVARLSKKKKPNDTVV